MKTSSSLAAAILIIFSNCTTEDSLGPKRPDTSGMSTESAKIWDQAVQHEQPSPQSQAHAAEAAKAFEYGIPPATLPPASPRSLIR